MSLMPLVSTGACKMALLGVLHTHVKEFSCKLGRSADSVLPTCMPIVRQSLLADLWFYLDWTWRALLSLVAVVFSIKCVHVCIAQFSKLFWLEISIPRTCSRVQEIPLSCFHFHFQCIFQQPRYCYKHYIITIYKVFGQSVYVLFTSKLHDCLSRQLHKHYWKIVT